MGQFGQETSNRGESGVAVSLVSPTATPVAQCNTLEVGVMKCRDAQSGFCCRIGSRGPLPPLAYQSGDGSTALVCTIGGRACGTVRRRENAGSIGMGRRRSTRQRRGGNGLGRVSGRRCCARGDCQSDDGGAHGRTKLFSSKQRRNAQWMRHVAACWPGCAEPLTASIVGTSFPHQLAIRPPQRPVHSAISQSSGRDPSGSRGTLRFAGRTRVASAGMV